MTDLEMKNYVKNAYPGENWKKKVDKMPKTQIYCVYESIKRREKRKKAEENSYHQLTIDEFLSNL